MGCLSFAHPHPHPHLGGAEISIWSGVRETRARAVKWLKLVPKLFHHRALIMIMTRFIVFFVAFAFFPFTWV